MRQDMFYESIELMNSARAAWAACGVSGQACNKHVGMCYCCMCARRVLRCTPGWSVALLRDDGCSVSSPMPSLFTQTDGEGGPYYVDGEHDGWFPDMSTPSDSAARGVRGVPTAPSYDVGESRSRSSVCGRAHAEVALCASAANYLWTTLVSIQYDPHGHSPHGGCGSRCRRHLWCRAGPFVRRSALRAFFLLHDSEATACGPTTLARVFRLQRHRSLRPCAAVLRLWLQAHASFESIRFLA